MQRQLTTDVNLGLGKAKVVEGGWRGLYQRVTDALSFGEKALHVAEMKNVWDQAGYTEERIKAELAADPSGASPIPFQLQVAAMNAAAAVTHNYSTMGYQIREMNKSWPFLGVHIASAYKDLQTLKTRPMIALRGLTVLAAAKLINWLTYKDDDEYKQLSTGRRDGFIFNTPVGWIGMPGPRGLQAPILGLMDETLRAASNSNPRFESLVGRSLEHILPSGGPAGITTAAEILANRTRGGQAIVPKFMEGVPESEKATRYQLPYAVEQMTGGLVPARQAAEGGYDPFKSMMLPPQHESVTRLRTELEELKSRAESARRAGTRFADQARLNRLDHAAKEIGLLSVKLSRNEAATTEDRYAVNRHQVAIAQRALGQ
jgi:hypothetical protein